MSGLGENIKMHLNHHGLLDLVISDTGIVTDDTYATAYLISILTDRRADVDDELPFKEDTGLIPPDYRGYVGDVLDEKGRLIGSKLWLLERALVSEDTRRRAESYVREALQWAIDDGYVRQNTVKARWNGDHPHQLDIDIQADVTFGRSFRINLSNLFNSDLKGVIHAL